MQTVLNDDWYELFVQSFWTFSYSTEEDQYIYGTGLCIAYLWICWDMLSERLVYWIPVGLFLYLLVKGIRHWHCVIQISEQGITTPKGKVLLWNKILYCQYVVIYGRYSHVELFLRTSQNYNETIHLNDYLCNYRELRAAIAFYSRGKVELESKEKF